MKRFLIFVTAIFLFISAENIVFSAEILKVAVLPIDEPTQGSSFTIYPNTLSLVAGEIVNTLSKNNNMDVINVVSAESILNSKKLNRTYKEFIKKYKQRYILDEKALNEIAEALDVNRILLVSGGFNAQEMILGKSMQYSPVFKTNSAILNSVSNFATYIVMWPWSRELTSYYRLNVIVTLIEPQSGIKTLEKNYGQNFKISDFGSPSQYFGENMVPIREIKKFSTEISNDIAENINEQLFVHAVIPSTSQKK